MDIQETIDIRYEEIEGLQQKLSEDHYMNPEQEDELEELIAKAIKFGELCAQRDAKAQAVPEWFDYTKQSPQMDGNYQIFIKGEQITAKWVSRFGFADPIEGDALRQELITHWAMQPQSPKAQEPAND